MAAPKGNKFAVGNKGGCPPRYKDPEEMQGIIDLYFEECEGKLLVDKKTGETVLNKYDEPIYVGAKPPTVTGLALALGFNTRLALLNYEDKEDFVNTVSRAKARVEAYTEGRLFDRDGANGAKFSLANNFKQWQDKQSVELSGPNGGPMEIADVPTLSDDDLQRIINIFEQSRIQGEVIDITPSE